jgi:threonine aldolase
MSIELADHVKENEVVVRFVLSFATPETDINRFLALVQVH